MASDSRANYAKTGFAVIAGFAIVFATLVYFGGCGGRGGEFLAETWYDSSVSGLSVGSEVNLRGVKVGAVKSISFIGVDYPDAAEGDRRKVRIVMAFNGKMARPQGDMTPEETTSYFVRRGMRATVAPNGITGLSKVELNFPAIPPPAEKTSWVSEYPQIPPAPSMLESFADSATKILNHLNEIDFAAVCSNLTSAVDSSACILKEIRTLVEAERPAVDAAISNLEAASLDLKEFAGKILDEPSLLLRSREEAPLPETAR